MNANGLTSIVIPDGVTSIEWTTFDGCSNLKWISIPASVTSIHSAAILNCTNLTDIYYGGSEYPATVPSGCNLHLNSTGPTN